MVFSYSVSNWEYLLKFWAVTNILHYSKLPLNYMISFLSHTHTLQRSAKSLPISITDHFDRKLCCLHSILRRIINQIGHGLVYTQLHNHDPSGIRAIHVHVWCWKRRARMLKERRQPCGGCKMVHQYSRSATSMVIYMYTRYTTHARAAWQKF